MTKVAILIDGGFFLKRLPSVRKDIDAANAAAVAKAIGQLTYRHLEHLNGTVAASSPWSLLYRCFYYDARPYTRKGHRPVSGKAIDYAKTPEAQFRLALFDKLRKQPNVVVRLGEVIRERSWVLKEDTQAALLKGQLTIERLTDDDFLPAFRQKAVDMRIGVDMASITLKKPTRSFWSRVMRTSFPLPSWRVERESASFLTRYGGPSRQSCSSTSTVCVAVSPSRRIRRQ
jgi:uncharacterized LabA/DUF88 family protein